MGNTYFERMAYEIDNTYLFKRLPENPDSSEYKSLMVCYDDFIKTNSYFGYKYRISLRVYAIRNNKNLSNDQKFTLYTENYDDIINLKKLGVAIGFDNYTCKQNLKYVALKMYELHEYKSFLNCCKTFEKKNMFMNDDNLLSKIGIAYFQIGIAYFHLDKFEMTEFYFKRSLEEYLKNSFYTRKYEGVQNIIKFYEKINDREKIIKYKIIKSNNFPQVCTFEDYLDIGNSKIESKLFASAIKYYTLALRRTTNDKFKGDVYYKRGIANKNLCKNGEELEDFEEAVTYYKICKDKEKLRSVYLDIAKLKNEHREKIINYKIIKANNFPQVCTFEDYLDIGNSKIESKLFASAIKYYTLALRRTTNDKFKGDVYYKRGIANKNLCKNGEALEDFEEAVTYYKICNDKEKLGSVYLDIAKLKNEQNLKEDADYFETLAQKLHKRKQEKVTNSKPNYVY